MSSSTERKNRQAARANGTDRKTIAEREAAAKKKKDSIKWTVVGICVLIFVLAVIYLNSGLFYRTATAVTLDNKDLDAYNIQAGSEDFSVAEVNYVYNSQLLNIVSYLGNYASYMGLDTSKPLDQQPCSFGSGNTEDGEESSEAYTWDDYFMDASYKHLKELGALCAYAKYAGISLDDDDMKAIENNINSISDAAKQNGFKSTSKFLASNYGMGCNVVLVRDMLKKEALASKVQTNISESFEYSENELTEKYASVADSYDLFDYEYYYVAAETTTDDDGNTSASEESMNAAKAIADNILSAINGGTDFEKALADIIGKVEVTKTDDDGNESTEMQDAAPTTGENVSGSEVPASISEWMIAKGRKSGDSAVIDSDSGYYVVLFHNRDDNQNPTEESGDMRMCDYVADKLLRNEDLSAWLGDVISSIEEIYSTTDHFAIKYVGR